MSPRSNLTKQIVVQAAADLINAEGLEALSLGRLANEPGHPYALALQPRGRPARSDARTVHFERAQTGRTFE